MVASGSGVDAVHEIWIETDETPVILGDGVEGFRTRRGEPPAVGAAAAMASATAIDAMTGGAFRAASFIRNGLDSRVTRVSRSFQEGGLHGSTSVDWTTVSS